MNRGGVLAGIIEQTNDAKQLPTEDPPVLIGDHEQCLLVMSRDPKTVPISRNPKAKPGEISCVLDKLVLQNTTTSTEVAE
jgi:hypothetical protein